MGKKRHNRSRPNRYLEESDRKNELMREYYTRQFRWSEADWDAFYGTMRTELPATFRVTGFRRQSAEVQWLIKNRLIDQLITDDSITESQPCPVQPLPWYPGDLAWQLGSSKVEIRRTPGLKRLHKFLISETDCGFISRQEAVSMVPPLLMDIEPHHRVLDLCAAPGSKAAQLLEMLHARAAPGTVPSGLVVASDIDSKRCYMMVHQLQRLQSPCIVVVRQDASIFPRLYRPGNNNNNGGGRNQLSLMPFDRILADVPCSGDGTLRKNQDLWPRWSPFLGVNEHFLQMKILKRALEMLADGGQMVYSTCSLNPVEDEAVVAAVLSQCHGTARLVDISNRLPGLESQPGLTDWAVMLKDKTWCRSVDDVPQQQRRSFRPSLFPPEDVKELNIQFCRRILPQHSNTGGFFVALIEKVSCLPWMKQTGNRQNNNNEEMKGEIPVESVEEEAKQDKEEILVESVKEDETKQVKEKILVESGKEDDSEKSLEQSVESSCAIAIEKNSLSGGPPRKKMRVFKEDPFLYVSEGDENWAKLKEFYDISDDFPWCQLMYRNAEGKRRNYYFTNEALKQLVEANADRDVNLVNLGVKVFGISEDKSFTGYRLLQEGIEIVEPYLGDRRRLTLTTRADLLTILTFDMPLISEFSPEMRDNFNRFSLGPVLFQYDPSTDPSASGHEMPRIPLKFAGWRGRNSVRHYVGAHERSHLLRLVGVEPADVQPAPRNDRNGPAASISPHSPTPNELLE